MSDKKNSMDFKAHKEDMKSRRSNRRFHFIRSAKELRELGFEVKEISKFQFRINEILDIYPTNKKYHNLKTDVHGDIRGNDFSGFVKKFFNIS